MLLFSQIHTVDCGSCGAGVTLFMNRELKQFATELNVCYEVFESGWVYLHCSQSQSERALAAPIQCTECRRSHRKEHGSQRHHNKGKKLLTDIERRDTSSTTDTKTKLLGLVRFGDLWVARPDQIDCFLLF